MNTSTFYHQYLITCLAYLVCMDYLLTIHRAEMSHRTSIILYSIKLIVYAVWIIVTGFYVGNETLFMIMRMLTIFFEMILGISIKSRIQDPTKSLLWNITAVLIGIQLYIYINH
jgi:hypothetical protein